MRKYPRHMLTTLHLTAFSGMFGGIFFKNTIDKDLP